MSMSMMCACTGRCKMWPFTCNGIPDPNFLVPYYVNVPAVPLGCVCPVGAEKACEGIACPRRNPLRAEAK